MSVPVLYQDDHMVAVGKPAGLLIHRSKIDYYEKTNLVQILSKQLGRRIYPAHRLDKPTSGALLSALSENDARVLSPLFEQRKIEKRYLAVARGYTHLHGCIDHPVGDKERPHREKVAATTYYRTLARIELPHRVDRYPTTRYSLLEIQPATGRRHQIRQHMKHINHPLIGDTSYGKTAHNRLFAQLFDCQRLLLHASMLAFTHPATNSRISIRSRLSDDLDQGQFARVLRDKRWQWIHASTSSVWTA